MNPLCDIIDSSAAFTPVESRFLHLFAQATLPSFTKKSYAKNYRYGIHHP